jgi:hypothetical protein
MSTVKTSMYGGVDYAINYRTDALGSKMDAQSVYPTDIGPAVLGEIWAPRLFATGLDSLELGGDGAVAVSADGKRAFELGVTAVLEADGIAEHDRTGLVFAQPAFRLGDAVAVSPLEDGSDAVALTGGALSLDATGGVQVAGAMVSLAATGDLDLSGATVGVTATQDIVLSSDGNPTMTIKGDRVIIAGDVDVSGAIDMGGASGDGSMAVGANFVELGDGRELEVTSGGAGAQQGLLINIVPDADGLVVDSDLDTYLRSFKDAEGLPAFYSGDALDATKYAAANRILYKGLTFNVNGGSSVAGKRTLASRMNEPFWDMSGGAMKVSRTVPDAATDLVSKLSMALRVTDTGELEVVRHKAPYAFADGAYVEGESTEVQVLARWGQTRGSIVKWLSSLYLRYTLGEAVSRVMVAAAEPYTTSLINAPEGLTLEDTTLTGTLATLAPVDFTVRVVTETEGALATNDRTFYQNTGVTGIGGGFGLPSGVTVVEPTESHEGRYPTVLFDPPTTVFRTQTTDSYWHSTAVGRTQNPQFIVTYPTATQVSHVRYWSHPHTASQRITSVLIYGDGTLIAEYGIEGRPVPPPESGVWVAGDGNTVWEKNWTELYVATTLAVPSPSTYSKYVFIFFSNTYASLGKMQMLDVSPDANVPAGLFLDSPTWTRVGPLYPSKDAPFSFQLATDTPETAVTYVLAKGSTLPAGMALSAEGIITGTPTAASGTASGVVVRAWIGGSQTYASTSVVVPFNVTRALRTLASAELYGRYVEGEAVATWGNGAFTQTEAERQPVFDASSRSAHFTGLDALVLSTPDPRILERGGFTTIARVAINTMENDSQIFSLAHDDPSLRIVLKTRSGGVVGIRIRGVETVIANYVLGKWITIAYAYDAVTGSYSAYVNGDVFATGTHPTYATEPTFSFGAVGATNGNTSDFLVKHVAIHAAPLSFEELQDVHLEVSTTLRSSKAELAWQRLAAGDAVAEWGLLKSVGTPVYDAAGAVTCADASASMAVGEGNRTFEVGSGGGLSVVLRVRVNSMEAGGGLLIGDGDGLQQLTITSDGSDAVAVDVAGASGTLGAVVPGHWRTLALVYDAATGEARTFNDGALLATFAAGAGLGDFAFNALKLATGSGSVDASHVSMWAHKLTNTQALAHTLSLSPWACMARGDQLTAAGPVASWGVGKTFVQADPAAQPSFDAAGKYLTFNGTNQFMSVTDAAARDMKVVTNGGWAVIMRIRSTAVGEWEQFFSAAYQSAGNVQILFQRKVATDTLRLGVHGVGVEFPSFIPQNTWFTVAASFNTASKTLMVYKDSVLVGIQSVATASPSDTPFDIVSIAFNPAAAICPYSAANVSHLSIFQRPLNANEMVEFSDATVTAYPWAGMARGCQLTTAGPVASWGLGKTFVQANIERRPTYNAVGKYVSFNGTNQFMEVTSGAVRNMAIAANSGWSVIMRIRSTAVGYYESFFTAGNNTLSGGKGLLNIQRNDSTSTLRIQANSQTFVVNDFIPQDTWFTLGVKYNAVSGVVTVFKDGVFIQTLSVTIAPRDDQFDFMYIGKSPYSDNSYMAADVSHLSIYHRPITDAELTAFSAQALTLGR